MDAADRAADQEAATLADLLERHARKRLDAPGAETCADCGIEIPAARRRALPSASRCVECQAWAERMARIPA